MPQHFLQELLAERVGRFEDSELSKYTELARLCYENGLDAYEDVVTDDHERIIGKKDGAKRWLGFRGSGLDPAHWLGSSGNCNASPGSDSVFRGFSNAMAKFLGRLQSWCEGFEVIHLTGHSRGGALATLAGWHLAKHFPNAQVNVVVFGCPRVGMASFAEGCRKMRNLRWAGFQHRHDPVGKVPPWGEHIHQPANPQTDFGTQWGNLLGNVLEVMSAFAYNSMKAHSMESYHQSLKCNFILRCGTSGAVTELIETITDPRQKAILAIQVQAVQTGTSQMGEHMQQMAGEMKELLSPERLQELVSNQFLEESATVVLGKASFLANMCSHGEHDEIKQGAYDLEQTLHLLGKQIQRAGSTGRQTLLIEVFLKGGLMLAMCRLKYLADTAEALKSRFTDLANDLHGPLLKVAHELQDADAFHKALPSLAEVEAACAAHLNNKEPLLLTVDIQEALMPGHLQPSEIQKDIRSFAKEFKAAQAAVKAPGGVARLLSTQGLGHRFIDLLSRILADVKCDSEDQGMTQCRAEVKRLEDRMDDLVLPEVVLTGPTNAGKSSLVNSILGMDVASAKACPDSLLPIRYIPQGEGSRFQLLIRGTSMDGFKSSLDDELKQTLRNQEMDTAEEVQAAVEKMNKELRKFLNSESFRERFSQEKIKTLMKWICADWAVEIKMPMREHVPSVILVDLPGSTEGGIAGEFTRTMVAGSCLQASTALLVLTPDMVTELDRDGFDPMQRFFGGASIFSSYFLIISKVFEKKVVDEVNQHVEERAGKLNPAPLAIRYINSHLLSAWAASCAGPLPNQFPVLAAGAGETEQQRYKEEEQRCEIVFRGVEGRMMKDKDKKKFDGPALVEELNEKLKEFPETATFIQELYTSVDRCFPELFLGPPVRRVQAQLLQLHDAIQQSVETCRKDCSQREQEMQACKDCLCNLASNMEVVRKALAEKVKCKLQGTAQDIAMSMSYENDITTDEVKRCFGPGVADTYSRNLQHAGRWHPVVLDSVFDSWMGKVLEVLVKEPMEMAAHFQSTGLCLRAAVRDMTRRPYRFNRSVLIQAILNAACVVGACALVPVLGLAPLASAAFMALGSQSFEARPSREGWLEVLEDWTDRVLSSFLEAMNDRIHAMLEQRLMDPALDGRQLEQMEQQLQQNLRAQDHLRELAAWVNDQPVEGWGLSDI